MNPYEPAQAMESTDASSTSAVLGGLRFGLLVFVATLAAASCLGTVLALLACLIDGQDVSQQSVAQWWFDNAHLLLVPPPLLFGFSAFLHVAAQKCRGGIAFCVLLFAGLAFHILLFISGLSSPRFLKGADPLFYPVEIWGYVVPYLAATAAILGCFGINSRADSDLKLSNPTSFRDG